MIFKKLVIVIVKNKLNGLKIMDKDGLIRRKLLWN